MTIISRPYRDHHDLESMRRLVMDARREQAAGYLHVGDVVWRIWDTLIAYEPRHVVSLWEDSNGVLIAFALFYPLYSGFNLQVHPQHRGGDVEEIILGETEQQLRTLMQHEGRSGTIDAWDVFATDTARIRLLEKQGFVRRPDVWFAATRSLAEPIPTPSLPKGFSIRSIASLEDVIERIAHRPDVTPERYQQFMQAPGYERDLDLVVEAPNGRFGAYCICWLDEVNHIGEFEPVGTQPDFRQQGLARALVLEGFQQMKRRGVETALVCYEGDNQPAQRLYTSVGFKTYSEIYTYTKDT